MSVDDREKFFAALDESLGGGTFIKLTLAKYRGPDAELRNVYVRPVELKGGRRLSFLHRYKTRDAVRNHTYDEGSRLVREMLRGGFASGHLFTSEADLRLEISRRGEARLTSHTPTLTTPAPSGHERRKRRAIDVSGSIYLRELGVTNERGEVRPAMGDKLRQINKFVEIVAGLYDSSPLKGREELSVLDVGSGKGYLTFALYDYLNNVRGVRAVVTGVEARAELVGLCNEVARRAGFERLEFRKGFIHDLDPPPTDVLIALHACDTATDDAIHKGVAAGAAVIVTAPCCHKEVRPQIVVPAQLRGVLRHGHLLEREAESVTDSLRALLLEAAGYRVKVFEFVSTEHTRKNTMIAAVRREDAPNREAALAEFRALKEFYGVREQRLEKLLCYD
ncbi:MAG TPA: SAM-dependent methyltransferase [Pyrinomonadaceae bacterium]|nr:SAM-dependent methyltransferase [Pyrinomonadaceae bacterium]